MEIKKFENSLIAFDFDSEMVNATDMLKSYPTKRINDYLRLKSTKEYISHLESVTGNPATVVKQGGVEQGTWMTQKLALDFGAWLDVRIRDFIYDTFLNSLKQIILKQKEDIKLAQLMESYAWNHLDAKENHRR